MLEICMNIKEVQDVILQNFDVTFRTELILKIAIVLHFREYSPKPSAF